jgi:hypothetical protein
MFINTNKQDFACISRILMLCILVAGCTTRKKVQEQVIEVDEVTMPVAKGKQVLPALDTKEQGMVSKLISQVNQIGSTQDQEAVMLVTVTNTPGNGNYPIALGRANNATKKLREMGYTGKIRYVFETGNTPSVSFSIVMVDKNAKCDHSQMIEALQQKYKETKVKLNDKQSKKDKKDKKDKVEKSEKKTKAEDDEDDEDDEKPSS